MASDQNIRKVQVFVSSPSDVVVERERIDLVAQRLNELFVDRVRIEPIRWENKFYTSESGFQNQIPPATGTDLVIAIFWSRLGTPLPEQFGRMENGERYPSGTAYEVLSAIDARRRSDRPDVYVFRKTEPFVASSEEEKAQWKDLNAFFSRWFQAPDGQYLRAFHRFETADEFEHQIERLLRGWIAERVPRQRGLIWPIETQGSPFRGLLPFDARHAAIYFGRDRKVTRAIEQLQSVARAQSGIRSAPRNVPFLLIVGESGAGKSSLMRAGLAPRLTASGVVPAVDLWRTAIARIGDDANPFVTLAKALLVENDEKGGFGSALPELGDGGRRSAEQLAELLAQGGLIGPRKRAPAAPAIFAALAQVEAKERAARKTQRRLRANLLLLIDQLENIFSGNIADKERAAFARLVFALCATRRVWTVATVRSDIYPRLITPGDFLALKDAGGVYDLAAPSEPELVEIVHKSAAAAGLVYEKDERTGERLDERILRDAQGQNMLPLLQFALERLFEKREVVRTDEAAQGYAARTEAHEEVRLTFDAYNKMKGLDGAIDQTAKAALDTLGPAEIRSLPRLLRCLAVPVHDRNVAAAASSGLTVRMVPRSEAVPDDASARLVKALIDARIIVATAAEQGDGAVGEDLIGIAHQRVFESWAVARKIIEEHRDFFRIRDEVENQRRRWEEKKRPGALLLAKGLPLAEAQQIVKKHGNELSPEIRAYVATSNRRAQRLNVFMGATAAVFAALFVASTILGLMTRSAQQTASANYQAAKGAIGNLVTVITENLRDTAGIEVETVQRVLKIVDETITKVQKVSVGDPELRVLRGQMLYQSGKAYQKKEDWADAFTAAKESLAIFSGLTHFEQRRTAPAAFASSPAPWRWQLSLSLELVGDLLREHKKFADARALFQEVLAIRLQLNRENPEDDAWALGISQVYTRMGDLDTGVDLAAAQRNYENGMEIAARFFEGKPEDERWQHELGWAYAKIGDVSLKKGDADSDPSHAAVRAASYATALDAFDNSLCLRRRIADREKAKTEWTRDVTYTLDRVGAAKQRLKDPIGVELAYFESLYIRRDLAKKVPDNTLYLGDIGRSLDLIGDHYRAHDNPRSALAFYDAAADVRALAVARSPSDTRARKNAEEAHKKADEWRQKVKAAERDEDFSGNWWSKTVGDAEHDNETLWRAVNASAESCMDRVTASVRQILQPLTTATVH